MIFLKSVNIGIVIAGSFFLLFLVLNISSLGAGFLAFLPLVLGIIGAVLIVIISAIIGAVLHLTHTKANNIPNFVFYLLIAIIVLMIGWIIIGSGLIDIMLGRY